MLEKKWIKCMYILLCKNVTSNMFLCLNLNVIFLFILSFRGDSVSGVLVLPVSVFLHGSNLPPQAHQEEPHGRVRETAEVWRDQTRDFGTFQKQ